MVYLENSLLLFHSAGENSVVEFFFPLNWSVRHYIKRLLSWWLIYKFLIIYLIKYKKAATALPAFASCGANILHSHFFLKKNLLRMALCLIDLKTVQGFWNTHNMKHFVVFVHFYTLTWRFFEIAAITWVLSMALKTGLLLLGVASGPIYANCCIYRKRVHSFFQSRYILTITIFKKKNC